MRKKLISITFVLALCCAMFFTSNVVKAETSQERLCGNNRYETNSKIVEKGWSESKYAVIASGQGFADALCASPLAKQYKAPILLTNKNTLNKESKEQLSRLKVKKVFIIGATGVIDNSVKREIEKMGIETKRIYGKDRFETSIEVAKNLKNLKGVVVTNAYGFADALSIAPVAAQREMAILFTKKNELPKVNKDFLSNKTFTENYVVGSTGVVSDKVASKLNNSVRLGGKNRYSTNSKILNYFSDKFNYGKVYVASGKDYPDALCGSALASLTKSPLILVGDSVDESVMSSVKANHNKYKDVIALGGTFVVSDIAYNSISEGIRYLNDSEALKLIYNANKLAYPVVETNGTMPSMHIGDKYYEKFEDKFNSKEKLFSYLNKYYTKSAINRFMSILEVKKINGQYCKKVGQLGDYNPDILNAKIINKSISKNKVDLVMKIRDSSEECSMRYKARLIYEDGKWRVDFWDGLMDI
ncbi:cell wall-binding repeat-containing protein [Clostridium oceanicum]|uniref:Cell wall-binding repeat-containing protein n=1 Tax=Clostridium oceanicum TaxID=1543 RepID=A0ABP3US16_9CLOT